MASFAEPISPLASRWRQNLPETGSSDELITLIAERFRLLGDPLRLKVLTALREGEQSVTELVTILGANQPNISKHLQALAQGGLVRRRRSGTSILYSLTDTIVASLCDAVCVSIHHSFSEQARSIGASLQEKEESTHASLGISMYSVWFRF
jgi:DNA-binding transcriptional ArsR family regulator